MDRQNMLDRFKLNKHAVLHQEVSSIAACEQNPLIEHRKRHLHGEGHLLQSQFMRQALLVN